jgi:hypothetical protein
MPINASTIRSVRAARASGGSKFVWLTPVAVPLVLTFACIGFMTYHQVLRAAESTRHSRPYGLLGPTVNVFLHDEDDDVAKSAPIRPSGVRTLSSMDRAGVNDASSKG